MALQNYLLFLLCASFTCGIPIDQNTLMDRQDAPDPVTDFPESNNENEEILIPIVAFLQNDRIEIQKRHEQMNQAKEIDVDVKNTTENSHDSDHETLIIANSSFKESNEFAPGKNIAVRSIAPNRFLIEMNENMDIAESAQVLIPLFTYRSQAAKRKKRQYSRFGSSEEDNEPYGFYYYRPSRSNSQQDKIQIQSRKRARPNYYDTATYSYVF